MLQGIKKLSITIPCRENQGLAMSEIINWWIQTMGQSDGWQRLLLFLGTWILLWLPIAIPIAIRFRWKPFQPLAVEQKLPLLGSLYLVAPFVMWGLLSAEGQTWIHYGLRWDASALIAILLGLGVALLSLVIVFGWELSQGLIVWNSGNQRQILSKGLPILALALWIGVTEEVIFRGCVQTELQADCGFWLAGIISSVIFALLHLVWERHRTLPQIPGLNLMGLVLTLAKFTDHDYLGLAIGLHTGWVWGLGCIDAAQLITYEESASPWLVGWYQQPLAGVAGVGCLLGTAVGLLVI
jgi:uncharacterized protein